MEIREAKSKKFLIKKRFQKIIISILPFDKKLDKINWKIIRFLSDMTGNFIKRDKNVIIKKIKTKKISGILIIPKKANNNIILHIHGGGFVNGSAKRSIKYCSMLAKYSNFKVISIDYSLAPEKPYPNAINDIYKAYISILEENKNCNISLIGESAGANLCLALTIRLINNGYKIPSSLILNSPIADLSGVLKRNYEVDDFTIKESCLIPMQKVYVKKENLYNPEISPIYFDKFYKFPPTYITCDYNELLRIDAETIYNKCKCANIETKLVIMKNSFHSFALMGTSTEETKKILEETCLFIKSNSHCN